MLSNLSISLISNSPEALPSGDVLLSDGNTVCGGCEITASSVSPAATSSSGETVILPPTPCSKIISNNVSK